MIKKKNNKIEFIILLLLLFVLIFTLEIPRKFFNVIRLTYDERLNISYDFCSNRSVGFINYIKNKHDIKTSVNFIKYTGVRNPNWIFFKRHNKQDDELYILLNYNNDNEIFLERIDKNTFRYNFDPKYNHRIFKKIIIENSKNSDTYEISIQNNLSISKDIIINKLNSKISQSSAEIYLKESTNKIMQSMQKQEKNITIKIKNNQKKLNSNLKIKIDLEHIYNISDYEIIEKINNCYLVVRK
jgi:hypothetical protein|tara:strand:+ start:13 stop:738 length:726 start_codon:yes stop_codon:yes gene_type:complete